MPDWSKFINNINAEDKNNSEVIVAVKDLCNFCRTLEVSLIKFENNVTLNWSASCGISNVPGAIVFPVTDTKLYDSVVTPSTQYNKICYHYCYHHYHHYYCYCHYYYHDYDDLN